MKTNSWTIAAQAKDTKRKFRAIEQRYKEQKNVKTIAQL